MKNSVIEAALNGKKKIEGKAYLFQGQKYTRYDWENDRPDDEYPKNLAVWKLECLPLLVQIYRVHKN